MELHRRFGDALYRDRQGDRAMSIVDEVAAGALATTNVAPKPAISIISIK